ncbi:HWE histidine kinase domain-containing protein [Ensifer sp.]|uniref:sensor histidine kinase n=1 Tax=Ensifer sp. TaxID=1872086 RepID=UPI0028A284A0|nr:HWE histidine kinase domain-containing protein [Ensifer sp.]
MLQSISEQLFGEVFITEELFRRPIDDADFLREKTALQELATHMIKDPDGVLPKFVQLAMEMTGGVSSGLSLYDGRSAPGIFHWKHLCGSLSAFEGATTPRNYSPCGVTLDQGAPVLTRHSERAYSWISDAGIEIPEVLLVPLYVGTDEPLGTLWVVSDEERHFHGGHARIAGELATFVGIALHIQRSQEELRNALEVQETLTKEMNHRVKNVFALTESLIRQTLKSSDTKHDMAVALSGRIAALSRAHDIVLRNRESSDTMGFEELLRAIVAPHDNSSDGVPTAIPSRGPTLELDERQATAIALIFNELATNAAKYGSLSVAGGTATISWAIDNDWVSVTWQERGGPRTEVPSRKGFGNLLVERTVAGMGGTLAYDWHADGMTAVISIPKSVFQ